MSCTRTVGSGRVKSGGLGRGPETDGPTDSTTVSCSPIVSGSPTNSGSAIVSGSSIISGNAVLDKLIYVFSFFKQPSTRQVQNLYLYETLE